MNIYEARKIFGINEKSSEEDIKKQYRILAKKYHPDANPGDQDTEEKFKQINEAYAVLTNKNGNSNDSNPVDFGFDLSEILRGHFNFNFGFQQPPTQNQRKEQFINSFKKPRPERTLSIDVIVPIMDILNKNPITLENINKISNCKLCNGFSVDVNQEHTCPQCNGTGSITKQTNMFFSSSSCYACGGIGIQLRKCPQCNPNGHTIETTKIALNLTTQVTLKTIYKIPGFGVPSNGITPEARGDLIVNIEPAENEFLAIRKGLLSNTQPLIVSISDIINQNKISIPVWDYEKKEISNAEIKLPPNVGFLDADVPVKIQPDLSFEFAIDDLGLLNDFGAKSKYLVYAVLNKIVQ